MFQVSCNHPSRAAIDALRVLLKREHLESPSVIALRMEYTRVVMSQRSVVTLLVAILAAVVPAVALGQPPNIVFILADDMGYGDVHALNPESTIPTPHLDSLAADGMSFTDAHTGSAVCTPTRYGLLTGRYAWRTRLKKGVLDGYGTPLIDRDRLTVAGLLQRAGYVTGIVGKWHLGLGFARKEKEFDFAGPVSDHPNMHGFDFSYVIPASLDFPPYIYLRNGAITRFPSIMQAAQEFPAFLREGPRGPDLTMENCLDDLLAQATAFIRRQAASEKPFFLYFPLTAPHKPVLPHPRFRGKSDAGPYGDFVIQVDWTVGQVLQALDGAGVAGDTLVIYASDNGSYMFRRDDPEAPDHVSDATIQAYRADRHRSNFVFRGTKADVWEGGHHVPFLVRWPRRVQAGSRNGEPMCLTDFMATAAEIAGVELPPDAGEDSFSILPLLEGRRPARPRAPVVHHSANGVFALRDGKWKLVFGNGSGGREQPLGQPFERPYSLFDMTEDISEQRNLIQDHPEVAARMEQILEEIRASGRSRP